MQLSCIILEQFQVIPTHLTIVQEAHLLICDRHVFSNNWTLSAAL